MLGGKLGELFIMYFGYVWDGMMGDLESLSRFGKGVKES